MWWHGGGHQRVSLDWEVLRRLPSLNPGINHIVRCISTCIHTYTCTYSMYSLYIYCRCIYTVELLFVDTPELQTPAPIVDTHRCLD